MTTAKDVLPEPIASLVRDIHDSIAELSGIARYPDLNDAIDRLAALASKQAPSDVLFDGYAVLQALSPQAQTRTSPENVSDVLDAVVRLMRASRPAEAQAKSEPAASALVANDGDKLWLWQNGDHFLAFRNLYPCFSPGGDPMTLGEPAAVAYFKESHNRTGKANT